MVIDFDKFSGKAQVRRATLSCDSSYLFSTHNLNISLGQIAYKKDITQCFTALTGGLENQLGVVLTANIEMQKMPISHLATLGCNKYDYFLKQPMFKHLTGILVV